MAVLGALILFAGDARADLLGDTLKPFASVMEMYDSNVFRVKDREQLRQLVGDDRMGDFITLASVGTAVHYTLSMQELDLLLRKDFIRYSHYTGQDTGRDEASGRLSLNVLDSVKIGIEGSYTLAPQPRADFRGADPNEVTTSRYGISAGYESTTGIGVEAAFRREEVAYSLAELSANEYTADYYSGTLSYRISPGAKVYASYQREERDYHEGVPVGARTLKSDNVGDSFRIGLSKRFTPRTAVSGHIGYLERRYSPLSSRDYSGLIGKAEITYGLTAKLGLVANWERQLVEETYTDRIYSINDLAGVGLVYQISEKLKGTVLERLSWKDFVDVPGSGVAPRSDFIQDLSAGLEWAPCKRLTVNLGYQYSTRSSDDDTYDFISHGVTTGIAYRF
ncbi:MAG: hypothetical protein ED859_00450 [Desulfuromonadales bacterium]|nr:MAG: hypothetical protein ED859_00450 [Desulfuromonadales bacterium]